MEGESAMETECEVEAKQKAPKSLLEDSPSAKMESLGEESNTLTQANDVNHESNTLKDKRAQDKDGSMTTSGNIDALDEFEGNKNIVEPTENKGENKIEETIVAENMNQDATAQNKDDSKKDEGESSTAKKDAQESTDQTSDTQTDSSQKDGMPDFSSADYELIDGHYYYTDISSGMRYMYDTEKGEWVEVAATEGNQQTTTDSEGRVYYYADDLYLCRDTEGHVFFMDEKSEWRPWEERAQTQANQNNWYFYQGDNMFYRDKGTGAVYKLNKAENKWEKFEGQVKKKKKRARPVDDEEEFDTDDDEEDGSDEDEGNGLAPPGATNDPNISYDGTTYTKVDPSDKMQYEWDALRRAWFPKVDEDFMATYQLSYGFNPDGTKDENPLKFDDDEEEFEEQLRQEEEEKKKKEEEKVKQQKKKPTWFDMEQSQNTKVYVSNLPDDMNEERFIALMQKCGMIMLDHQSGHPKIKLYRDNDGNFKGDALCSYMKIESVELAEQILDDYEVQGRKIHVEKAKFQLKGRYNPKLKPRKKPKKELDKIQRRQEKLLDWRPDPLRGERRKHEVTVVIRNAFDPKEFHTAMEKILDHKQAIRNHCSNFGDIKKLELYDLHPDGVVQVTFVDVESADLCVASLNQRLYCSRTLKVATWDGKEKFKIVETEAEKEERIKKWNQFLETSGDSDTTATSNTTPATTSDDTNKTVTDDTTTDDNNKTTTDTTTDDTTTDTTMDDTTTDDTTMDDTTTNDTNKTTTDDTTTDDNNKTTTDPTTDDATTAAATTNDNNKTTTDANTS